MITAVLGVGLAVSAAGNVTQAITNRKLRKQLEELTFIIESEKQRRDELEKKLEAQKNWSFMEKSRARKELKEKEKEIAELNKQLIELGRKIS